MSPLEPLPRRSIAVTCRCSARADHTGSHGSIRPIPPCTSSRTGPVPAVSRPMLTSSAPVTECLVPSTAAPTTHERREHKGLRATSPSLDHNSGTGRPIYMTTFVRPRNFALATDRSVVPPRFAPGLPTTHGGVPTGDPDVSPDQAFPGWLSQFSWSRHVIGILLLPWRPSSWAHAGTTPSQNANDHVIAQGVDHVIPQPVR